VARALLPTKSVRSVGAGVLARASSRCSGWLRFRDLAFHFVQDGLGRPSRALSGGQDLGVCSPPHRGDRQPPGRRRDRPKFLAEEFAASMETLGYLPTPIHKMKRVRSDEKNLPLYYIALFSRQELAHRFWDDVLKYGTDQTKFPWALACR
jgi:hypothetical protein